MRGKTIDILKEAMKGGYAVGAFNTFNMEVSQAIARAGAELGKPCIIQMTINAMNYAGDGTLGEVIKAVINKESNSTPVGFHLDHGHSIDDVMRGMDSGVDSVMIDVSKMKLAENIQTTRKVVEYAHAKGVTVQAELGRVPYLGVEEIEVDWEKIMTNPDEAKKMVDETGIDALAVGIGNAHGFFRERQQPDWERLKRIKSLIPNTPLILHGASDWTGEKVKRAVEEGICCFNIDTDIRIAFSTAICHNTSAPSCDVSDPRKFLFEARKKVTEKIKEKISIFSLK